MALNRSLIVKTPGKVVFDPTGTAVPLYSSDGISFEIQETLVMLPDLVHGESEQIVTARLAVVKFKPTSFTAAGLAKLFTHGAAFATRPGSSIIPTTDALVDVVTMDGKKRRLSSAFIYGEPALTCEIGKTICGEVTIYGIIPTTGGSDTIANLATYESVVWSDTGWDPADEITPGWDFSWPTGSASAWDEIVTKGGVTITPKSTLVEDIDNAHGLRNVSVSNYGVEAKASVLNISEALIRTARFGSSTQPLGTRKTSHGPLKLNATSGDAYIRVYGAQVQPNVFTYNANDTQVNELTWLSNPTVAAGLKTHLLVTTTDPDV